MTTATDDRTAETSGQIAPVVLRRFTIDQSFDRETREMFGEMRECAAGDYVLFEDAEAVIEKLVAAIEGMLIGCSGVGVPHAGERELLQECVNAAIRLKREAVGPKAVR